MALFEEALELGKAISNEKLFAAIEDRVYLNKIFCSEKSPGENILRRGFAEEYGKEYCLDVLMKTIDADPKKLTDWYTKWIEDETEYHSSY